MNKSEKDWKKILSPQQFAILRKKRTEPAFTGEHLRNKKTGIYFCAGCGNELFSSKTKYDSGTGWPSFFNVLDKSKINLKNDFDLGIKRIKIACSKCGGHLGHVFDDGPKPTGKRYCINSLSLNFKNKRPW